MTFTKETFKELLDLKGDILVPVLGGKLATYARLIYFIGLAAVIVMLFGALWTMVACSVSLGFLKIIWAVIFFVMMRMFCEFLAKYKKA